MTSAAPRQPSLAEIVDWDVGNWSQALGFWEGRSRLRRDGLALEIGAAGGGLSLWLAHLGFRVICSDRRPISVAARALHAKYGLASQIEYRTIDATSIPFRDELDLVCFKSVLGGVGADDRKDRQQQAVEQMRAALKPNGEVWFAENLVGSAFHRWTRARFVKWGHQWRWVTVGEVGEFFGAFRHLESITFGVVAAFGRSEWQRTALARVDRWLTSAVPGSWHYIIVGLARK
jgi:SAM-dependent methyltransferase